MAVLRRVIRAIRGFGLLRKTIYIFFRRFTHMPTLSYHEQMDIVNIKKLRELQKELPAFAGDFFRAMEIKKATNTRRNYAYDLSTFFFF